MTLQTDIETFLTTDLYTVAGALMKLKSPHDVYPDSRVRANRNANEILFSVERGSPVNNTVGSAVVVTVSIQLFIATVSQYDAFDSRIEDIFRVAAETLSKAYHSWRGAARFRAALDYPVDTVACFEGGYDTILPVAGDSDNRVHLTKSLTLEIHAYED